MLTVWTRDLTTYTKGNKALKPARTYTHHSAIVNDVEYHPLHSSLIGSVSDDITLQILDIREPDTTRAAASTDGQHRDAINSVAFNPAAETVLATGSADKTIGLWDLRNLKSKLHALEFHTDSVTSVSWHPFEESVLASASYDRKIMFWDLSRAGEEQTPDDAQDGPPELYVVSFSFLLATPSKQLANPNQPAVCSCTVVTPTVSPTSTGTSTTPGFSALPRRTTCCRSGRCPTPLSARIWRTSQPKNWNPNRQLDWEIRYGYLNAWPWLLLITVSCINHFTATSKQCDVEQTQNIILQKIFFPFRAFVTRIVAIWTNLVSIQIQ